MSDENSAVGSGHSRLASVPNFELERVQFDRSTDPVTYEFVSCSFGQERTKQADFILPSFPVLLRESGLPWDVANLYLLRYFDEKLMLNEQGSAGNRSIEPLKSVRSVALGLLNYLRFIEQVRNENPSREFHELYFPPQAAKRVTYRYRAHLMHLIAERKLAPATASNYMNAVIGFYDRAEKWGILKKAEVENAQEWVEKFRLVRGDLGLTHMKNVRSSDLAITVARKDSQSAVTEHGQILDGGDALTPISFHHFDTFMEVLESDKNATMQMICKTSLATGARLQTICTLRISDVKEALARTENNLGRHSLFVGYGCNADIKGETNGGQFKRSVLQFPTETLEMLMFYIESKASKKRRSLSFYGDTDDNYVFLSRDGNPFYTSKRELVDRKKAGVPFDNKLLAEGNSVQQWFVRFRKRIQQQIPSFTHRFHDLRATFAVRYLHSRSEANVPYQVSLNELKSLMGHASQTTTQLYLDYLTQTPENQKLIEEYDEKLRRSYKPLTESTVYGGQ